jgi:broad specificity phosphatase PhoE
MDSLRLLPRIHLIRHGETEWSLSGRHTSRTDLPLTPEGEKQAVQLKERLPGKGYSHVFTSPRLRARRTCELAGLGASAEIEADLREWEYGDYEGLKSPEIYAQRPDWNLFFDGAPNGESPAEVYARAEGLIRRLQLLSGEIAVFSHGHFLRVLAAAWVGLPVVYARRLALNTASLGILNFEYNLLSRPVIELWNQTGPAVSTS